jgi:hypothetical protein
MDPLAEYHKGTGPKQLPQGAATAANRATPDPAQPMDIPVQYATEADHPQLPPDGADDNLDILTAPPHPGYAPNLLPRSKPNQIPQSVVRNLPRLQAAAMDPDAPETTKATYKALVWELNRQQGG